MNEKEESFPNVSLGGKINKQKGETDSGHLRYGQNGKKDGKSRKKSEKGRLSCLFRFF
ncbi:hypothetical protein AB1K84_08905 [Mesobacillus foraminis]|uniref:hypothetical protein n=1 Tax=Mesobacillus foraminis TaxID=279826 RepID=UPI0039A1EACD